MVSTESPTLPSQSIQNKHTGLIADYLWKWSALADERTIETYIRLFDALIEIAPVNKDGAILMGLRDCLVDEYYKLREEAEEEGL
jgi:hypothetical protein